MNTLAKQLNTIIVSFASLCIISGFAQAKYYKAQFPSASEFNRPKDNPVLSQKPGLTYTFQTEYKDKIVTNEVTTTFDSILTQGIRCSIVYNSEWTYVKSLNKKIRTREVYKFFAWDNKGNVWYFGQDDFKYLYNNRWQYKGLSTRDSWLAGKNGAIPQIIIPYNTKSALQYASVFN